MAGSLANFSGGVLATTWDDCCRGASFPYNKCFGKLRDITNHITIYPYWIGKLEEFLDLKTTVRADHQSVESKAQIPLCPFKSYLSGFSQNVPWFGYTGVLNVAYLGEKCVPWIPPSLGRQKKHVFPPWKSGWNIIHRGSSSAASGLWVSMSGAAEIQERGLTNMLARSLIGEASWFVAGRENPKVEGFCGFFLEGNICFGKSDTVVFSCLASQYVF